MPCYDMLYYLMVCRLMLPKTFQGRNAHGRKHFVHGRRQVFVNADFLKQMIILRNALTPCSWEPP